MMKELLKPSILWMLIFVPVSIFISYVMPKQEMALFITSCLGLVVLAYLISQATEQLAEKTGPTIGGLLNASFSNLPEIIFGITALRAGLGDLVKASMTGAIIGNLLLVLGHAMFVGGLRHGTQYFSRDRASDASTGLLIASVAILLPTVYHQSAPSGAKFAGSLSLWLSALILVCYFASIVYTLTAQGEAPVAAVSKPTPATDAVIQAHKSGPKEAIEKAEAELKEDAAKWSTSFAVGILAGSSFLIAMLSDSVADSIGVVKSALGLSELFLGVIVVAAIGNVSSQMTSVAQAMKNNMDLAFEVAISASVQVALLVVPLLVMVSYIIGKPMDLEFTIPEFVALGAGVLIVMQISSDGKSHWLNGVQLLSLWSIIGVLFYFLPVK
ncbi:MAG: calcium/proton exchanger [Candidatus Methylacidiphilales bacterium]|nr:calcium/proton exchanger [Candidatus Methylacidiphilales bacterium]